MRHLARRGIEPHVGVGAVPDVALATELDVGVGTARARAAGCVRRISLTRVMNGVIESAVPQSRRRISYLRNAGTRRRHWPARSRTARRRFTCQDFDTGNVMGPWLVTADEVEDPYDLTMVARVNGEEQSRGHSGTMRHRFEDIIAVVSRSETLHPGKILGSSSPTDGNRAATRCAQIRPQR